MNIPTQTDCPPLTAITAPVSPDLEQLNRLILDRLHSPIPLIQEIVKHILKGKGKRLRPLLVILSARACNYQAGSDHLLLAAIIEFVHTATLLHDDVVDESKLRRGNQTANTIWGNQASVLVGDFLYSRAFQMLTELGHTDIMQILADTTNTIAEGEVLQLMNCQDITLSESDYFDTIYRKTAKLFESSAQIGAALTSHEQQHMADYGRHLGLCFQVVDDLLDYTASTEQIGKNIGDDLADGKMTLPLIYTLEHVNTQQHELIKHAIEHGATESLPQIIALMQSTNAIERSTATAQQHAIAATNALKPLTSSPYKQALLDLVHFAAYRSY